MFRRKAKVSITSSIVVLLVLSVISVPFVTTGGMDDDHTGNIRSLFAGGRGTENDPYLIEDVHQLQNISSDLSAHYALANDIDASETHDWGWDGFQQISSEDEPFTGGLDGRNHNITGAFVNLRMRSYGGLFGYIGEDGYVRNVGLVDMHLRAAQTQSSGSLAGYNHGTVDNSYAVGTTGDSTNGVLIGTNHGTVTSSWTSGDVSGVTRGRAGLVALNEGSITDSHSSVNISGAGGAGLVLSNNGNISNSYATGDVVGDGLFGIGGLASSNQGIIKNSYATGDVTGERGIGGLVGNNWGEISNSYATGDVQGNISVGGLVGSNGFQVLDHPGNVYYSYSTGHVDGESGVGGLVGTNEVGDIEDSFWDVESSGLSESAGGEGKTTAEMMDVTTYDGAGWDIRSVDGDHSDPEYTWNIIEDETYPFLSWEREAGQFDSDGEGRDLPLWQIILVLTLGVTAILAVVAFKKGGS